MWLAPVVFALAVALDFADARHKIAVEDRRVHAVARWSVAMYALGVVGSLAVIKVSAWLVIPEACGLYLGSVIAMRQARRSGGVKRV